MSEQPRRLPRRHVLYRMRDAEGVLLYVGITANVENRLGGHRGDKGWWNDIASIELQHFPSRFDLEEAEKAAVRDENPLHNLIRFRSEPQPSVSSLVTDDILRKVLEVKPDDSRGPKLILDADLWEGVNKIARYTNHTSWEGVIERYIRWFLGRPMEPILRRRNLGYSLKKQGLKVPQPRGRIKTVRPKRLDADLWLRFKQAATLLGASPSVMVEDYLWWWMRRAHAPEPKQLADLLPDDLRD